MSQSIYSISTNAGGTITAVNGATGTITGISHTVEPKSLQVQGKAIFSSDIIFEDKSLGERLNRIEKMLGILNNRPDLEERVDDLKELAQQYNTMVRELDHKQKILDVLVGDLSLDKII